jgi:CRISPR/Cas system-associated endonuclease Cas3-HD
MAVSVRLDAKTESLIGWLARKRRQTKSEVIRDAIGVLAKQEEKSTEKKRPYDLVAHLIGCVDSGGANLSQNTGEKFAKLLQPPFSLTRSHCWPCSTN